MTYRIHADNTHLKEQAADVLNRSIDVDVDLRYWLASVDAIGAAPELMAEILLAQQTAHALAYRLMSYDAWPEAERTTN